MINAYSRGVTLATDGIVPLNTVTIEKGCSVSLLGTSSINLKKAGVYKVEFYAESLAGVSGAVQFSMLVNGVAQQGNTTRIAGATTTGSVTVPIVALVQVGHNDCKCNCNSMPTVIQFVNDGVATISDVNVVVTKIC